MQYLSISSPISCLLALAPLTALKVREAAAVEIMERLGLDLPYFKLAFQLLPLTVLLLGWFYKFQLLPAVLLRKEAGFDGWKGGRAGCCEPFWFEQGAEPVHVLLGGVLNDADDLAVYGTWLRLGSVALRRYLPSRLQNLFCKRFQHDLSQCEFPLFLSNIVHWLW